MVHRNYKLLELQIKHWRNIPGDYRLLFCDNTPAEHRAPVEYISSLGIDLSNYHFLDVESEFDCESHGLALDYLVGKAETKIIGICDSDFFFMRPDVFHLVASEFRNGAVCVGTEFFYMDHDPIMPLVPCVIGMFVLRDLAVSDTFALTESEREGEDRITGWRLRKRLRDENLVSCVWGGFKTGYPGCDAETKRHLKSVAFYGEDAERPIGAHFFRGSSRRSKWTNLMTTVLETRFK